MDDDGDGVLSVAELGRTMKFLGKLPTELPSNGTRNELPFLSSAVATKRLYGSPSARVTHLVG